MDRRSHDHAERSPKDVERFGRWAPRYERSALLKAVTLDFWDTLFVSHGSPDHDRRQIQQLVGELGACGEPRNEAEIGDALLVS